MDVPQKFTIGIPVYHGFDLAQMDARLRYRIHGGQLTMWYDLLYVDRLMRDTFRQVVQQIAEGVELPIINGMPEGAIRI
jgi:hypothetical protein